MMMNQIFQWSFQHPCLAALVACIGALVACIALAVIYNLLFNILQVIDNVMARFQWWMIAGRLRDEEGNFTREDIDSFRKLVDKIEKNEAENTTDRQEYR